MIKNVQQLQSPTARHLWAAAATVFVERRGKFLHENLAYTSFIGKFREVGETPALRTLAKVSFWSFPKLPSRFAARARFVS